MISKRCQSLTSRRQQVLFAGHAVVGRRAVARLELYGRQGGGRQLVSVGHRGDLPSADTAVDGAAGRLVGGRVVGRTGKGDVVHAGRRFRLRGVPAVRNHVDAIFGRAPIVGGSRGSGRPAVFQL